MSSEGTQVSVVSVQPHVCALFCVCACSVLRLPPGRRASCTAFHGHIGMHAMERIRPLHATGNANLLCPSKNSMRFFHRDVDSDWLETNMEAEHERVSFLQGSLRVYSSVLDEGGGHNRYTSGGEVGRRDSWEAILGLHGSTGVWGRPNGGVGWGAIPKQQEQEQVLAITEGGSIVG